MTTVESTEKCGIDRLICKPLENLEEVYSWSSNSCLKWEVSPLEKRTTLSSLGSSQCCHKISSEWRPQKLYDRSTVPRTLVCHDMKGGYLDDRFVHGTDKHSDYRFFHWAGVDIFVYFSHKFLTIPPPVWVNAAHLHGVLILGTLITENEAGRKILDNLLHSSEECLKTFVSQLTSISECYGLDGWLLNVENCLEPKDVPRLKLLVSMLTSTMHTRIPHSQVIWYDSITVQGQLSWQNELNLNNRAFFDSCDGIFLNYAWTEKQLANSVREAGIRALDIYVGVDVFGRGCFGGGGFNTREAVEKVRAHDLSVALFAPGWVHECWGSDNFTPLEYTFWRYLWPLLFIHGPTRLPFETSFCQGFGLKQYKHGQIISDQPWHNLSLQKYQPCVPSCVSKDGQGGEPPTVGGKSQSDPGEQTRGCVQHWANDAFQGGGCLLLLRPTSLQTTEPIMHRLLMCSFEINEGELLLISYAIKYPSHQTTNAPILDLGLLLLCQERQRGAFRCEYLSTENSSDGRPQLESEDIARLREEFPVLQTQLDASPNNGWIVRHFVIPATSKQFCVTEVCVALGPKTARTLLGWLALQPFKCS